MTTSFGPWATAAGAGSKAHLSTFWKRRLTMLPATYHSSTRLGRRAMLCLSSAAALTWALPTLRRAAAQTQEEKRAAEPPRQAQEASVQEPAGDAKLRELWGKLDEQQAARLARQHAQAIVFAAHVYAEKHEGSLPPAAVPNPNVPPEKRLNGLVLLLPHLGVRPSYIPAGERWDLEPFDEEVYRAARDLHKKIDLTGAWDDPANLKAAKTVVSIFLVPGGGPFRDASGYALWHFAFVQGAKGEDNGVFPKNQAIKMWDIKDGTSNTLAVGQVHDHLGPWIAAGAFVSRFIYHPADKTDQPTFGSQFGNAAYFALADGSGQFLDVAKTKPGALYSVSARADGEPVDWRRDIASYASAVEWKASQKGESEK